MELYNKELKERFIVFKNETSRDTSYLEVKFKRTAEFENKLNKDVSCFTGYEIIDMYKMLNFTSFNTLSMFHSVMSQYTSWCISQGIVPDNQNHFMEFSRKQFNEFQNTLIKQKRLCSRKQILEWCRELPNPCDSFTMLSLFEGIGGFGYEEIIKAKFSDVNVGNKTITLCSGRTVDVSSELITYARESSETFEYTAITGNGRTVKLKSDPQDLIVKWATQTSSHSYKSSRHRIYYRLVKSFDYLGVGEWMTIGALSDSGKIHYIKERSEELGIEPIEYVKNKEHYDELQKRFNFEMNPSSFIECYKGYLT